MEQVLKPDNKVSVDCWLRKWNRHAVVEGKEPLERCDMDQLIEVNGGTAEKLNLSERDLRGANLETIDLKGAFLHSANLQKSNLRFATLDLADLSEADLRGADLSWASLQEANLARTLISSETNLEGVTWDKDYISVLEQEPPLELLLYEEATALYRTLKIWHQNHGFYDIAGEFHHREWVCRRKAAWKGFGELIDTSSFGKILLSLIHAPLWNQLGSSTFLWFFYEQLFGYGERPWRVARAALVVIVGLTFVYFPYSRSFCWASECWGALGEGVWKSLYFSAVSFTALGYGGWVEHPTNWTRYLGVVESFIGVLLIALFLVTFTRKMTR